MNSAHFDALARSWGFGSRRECLSLLAAGAMSVVTSRFFVTDAVAKKKRKKKKKCKSDTKKCGKRCIATDACCTNADCGEGGACGGGVCFCAIGFRSCQGKCFLDTSDCCRDADCPANSGKICPNGTCVCPPGHEDSGGTCGVRPTCRLLGSRPCDATCCTWPSCGVGNFCAPSDLGEPCNTNEDCRDINNDCVGFVCT